MFYTEEKIIRRMRSMTKDNTETENTQPNCT